MRKQLKDSIFAGLSLEDKETNKNNPEAIIELDSDSGIRAAETKLPEELKDKCLIGGLLREKLKGGKCPTRDNDCSGKSDGFHCGPIFNRVCISRTPVNSLSDRCMKASKGQALSTENYKRLLENDPVSKYCSIHPENRNCQRYPQLNQLSVSSTEAEHCEVCDTSNTTRKQEVLLDVSSSVLSLPFGELLSDTLYGRAECSNRNGRCSRHDRCIPGKNDSCKKDNGDCKGTKRKSQPLGRCAGYLNTGLNLVLRDYLKKYCAKKKKNMNQCKKNKQSDICNTNFVMPSALCALNLDGIDRIDGNTARYIDVRNRCNSETPLYPTHITVNGKKIPLFKNIPMPKDPNDLPVGAIVVSKSTTNLGRKHGHIEIKTNKDCNGSACFCSDFCSRRDKNDYKRPNDRKKVTYPYSVAFQLNPEVAKALETL